MRTAMQPRRTSSVRGTAQSGQCSDGFVPLAVYAATASECLGREFVGGHLGLGQEAGHVAGAAGEHDTLGALVDDTVVRHCALGFEFNGAWRLEPAVVPDDLDRAHAVAGGELVGDHRRQGQVSAMIFVEEALTPVGWPSFSARRGVFQW